MAGHFAHRVDENRAEAGFDVSFRWDSVVSGLRHSFIEKRAVAVRLYAVVGLSLTRTLFTDDLGHWIFFQTGSLERCRQPITA